MQLMSADDLPGRLALVHVARIHHHWVCHVIFRVDKDADPLELTKRCLTERSARRVARRWTTALERDLHIEVIT